MPINWGYMVRSFLHRMYNSWPKRVAGGLILALALLLLAADSYAITNNLFGPKVYLRTTGAPNIYTDIYTDAFDATAGKASLIIENGDAAGGNRVTSAVIYLNGKQIFGLSAFKQTVYKMERDVDLNNGTNILQVELRSKPGSYLTIQVSGEVIAPPTVTISANPLLIMPSAASTLTWNSTNAASCSLDQGIGAVPLTGSIDVYPTQTTAYTITAAAKDPAENPAQARVTIEVDALAPVIQISSPAQDSYVNTPVVTVAGSVNEPVTSITVNGVAAEVVGTDFSLSGVSLIDGPNAIAIAAKDRAGNTGTATINVNLDREKPVIQIISPVQDSYVNTPAITVTGSVSEQTASLKINGADAQVTDTAFSLSGVALAEGSNVITVEAIDRAGNYATTSITVFLDTEPPAVQITSPPAAAYLNLPAITVTGAVSEPVTSVTVNGVAAFFTDTGFSLAGLALVEGTNTVTAEAKDRAGNTGTATITVVLDTVPPVINITAPQPDDYLNTPIINVTGTINEPVSSVTVNGVAATITGNEFSLSGLSLIEGANNVTVEAKDRAGNVATAMITVVLDTVPPVINITAPQADAYLNTPAITVTGTINEPDSSIAVNGVAATITGNEFSLGGFGLVEGANNVTVEAIDPAGNRAIVSINVNLDTAQPVIQITSSAPDAYINTPVYTLTGKVSEPVSSITVNGVAAQVAGTDFSLSGVNLVEGQNTITVQTSDRAGNPGGVTLTVNLDTIPPVVQIASPVPNSYVNAPAVTVAGAVSEPVSSVTVNGIEAQVAGTDFILTGFPLAEGQNSIVVTATDRAGNTGRGSVSLTLDTTPPVITLTAPAQAAAGANIIIANSAADSSGLKLCELFVNNAPVWSFTANFALNIAKDISYSLSPDLAPGTTVTLLARAQDVVGNIGAESVQITISQGPSGPGYIQGQIYDDTKGLRLDGATAGIYDANGQAITQITTQTDGRYFYQTQAGDYLIMLAKDGFTAVERMVNVRPEKNSAATDARLTPVSAVQNLVGAGGGKVTIGSGGQGQGSTPNAEPGALNMELNIPAGALNQQTDIRLTPVSNQGLAGSLPLGWSPIAAVDIQKAGSGGQGTGMAFAEPANLKVALSPSFAFAPSSTITFSSYDSNAHQWIVQGLGTVSADGAFIAATIPSSGQYAFVLPDHGRTPPALAPGQPLPPFSVSPAADNITAAGKVIPPAAPPAIGLRALAEIILNNDPSPLSSGLIVNGRVTERFDLLTGEAVVPQDYVQDIVLYQYPCVTNIPAVSTGSTLNADLGPDNAGKVGTSFPVTPSREFTIIDLLAGKVSIEIALPATEAAGVMVGAEGARLSDADGNILVIPQNALALTVPVEMKTIAPALVAGIVGTDFNLLRAIEIKLANRNLAETAELSIPTPQGLNPALPIVVAKLIDVRGASKLKLVALANVSGSLITSFSLPAGGMLPAPGINTSGTYFFLQSQAPLGFVKGLVADVSGNAYPSALVSSSTCSLVDLTGADGNYLVASTVSVFTVTALDIDKCDTGSESGALTEAYQTATVNLTIRAILPSVNSITFTDNGHGIEPNTSITIVFNKALDKTTITSDTIVLKDASGNIISGAFSINPEGTIATFYPANLLVSQGQYILTISQNIKDLQGYLMGQEVVKEFTIRNTTPPPLPPAGSIVGSFPDASGWVTVAATQGSADPNVTALIVNDNTGEVVSARPASDGSFSGRIRAMLGDEIKILLMDDSGNQTIISYITFKSDDGRHLVTTRGGTVEGESGTRLIIPDGALLGPTIVRITPLMEADLPQPVPPEARYLAAVNIDAGGARFLKPIKISVPAPAGLVYTALRPPFLSRPSVLENADGTKENVYVVLDSAKVIDGRLATASPPFTGALTGGNFVFTEWPNFDVAIISGYTYRDVNGTVGYQPGVDLPVRKAVIRTPGAMNFVSFSDDNGFYAALAEISEKTPGYPCRPWGLVAINPLTMYRHVSSVQICNDYDNTISNFNIQLGGQTDATPPDKTPPEIDMKMTVVPGQENSPQFIAGAIPVGTDIEVPIEIIDQEMGAATLSVTYNASVYPVQLSQAGYSIFKPVTADNPAAIGKNIYQPSFVSPLAGSQSRYFRPGAPGTYAFILSATDAAGNSARKTMTVRAVSSGEIPGPIDGAPMVLGGIYPKDKSIDVSVGSPIVVFFSEPVNSDTLNANSFRLIDLKTGAQVAADIYISVEGGIMKATLQPRTNLSYGHEYEIVLTRDITDSNPNPSQNGGFLPLDQEYRFRFTTKAPDVYDLAADAFGLTPGGRGGSDIALYRDRESGRSYSYVTAEEAGWRAVDVTDPTNPVVTHKVNYSNPPDTATPNVAWRFRGAAVDEETGILALTEWIIWSCADCGNFGYVGFYDVKSDPAKPSLIGRERLAENFSGVPHHVVLSGDYAYVATIGVGIQVVDIEKSKGAHQPGEAIIGYYDTVGEGYGSPFDVAFLKGNLYVPTSSGHFLVLSVSNPAFPELIGKINLSSPSAAYRVSVMGDYTYADSSGAPQTMDIAVVSHGMGNLSIVNITDPRNPVVISGMSGVSASGISINRKGMIYVADGTTVDVIDIKDPYNPKRLNDIGNETYADGTEVTLGSSSALAEQDGWVYLANQQYGMRALDMDADVGPVPVPERKEDSFCGDGTCNEKDTKKDQCALAKSAVNTLLGEYQREAVDLVVKALGGGIEVRRRYYDNKWTWNHAGVNLIFNRKSDGKIESIAKGGVLYIAAFSTPDLYINGTYRIAKKTDNTGWRWTDTAGAWKEYDVSGRLSSYGDRTGIAARLVYEQVENGKLIGVTDRNNRQVIWYEYNTDNSISAVRDMINRHVEYAYTGGNLTGIKDVLGNTTTHGYDTGGRLIRTTDAAGRESVVNYDTSGKVSSVVNSRGEGTFYRYAYDRGRQEHYTSVETSAGTVKEIWYDKDGDTIRVDLNGRTIKKIIKDGLNQTIIDEAGNSARKEYDVRDNLIRIAYPDGASTAYEYEPTYNRRTKETNEKGIVTRYEYDGNGNLTRKIEAQGTQSERTTTYTYDANNNLLTTTTSADANTAAAVTTMTYDANGNVLSITDPENQRTEFAYDAMGNVLTKTDARGKTWTYAYNAKGWLTSVADPLTRTTSYEYDGVGNRIKETDAANNGKTYAYDGNNKVTLITDSRNNITAFSYDADGKLTKQTDAEGKVISYAYDADGRLIKTTDGNGNETAHVYDAASGCSSCGGGGNGSKPSRTIYPTFTREYSYDTRGRKTIEKDVLSDMESATSQFAYDATGNLTSRTDKEGKTTTYNYDSLNRLKTVTDPLNQTTTYAYDNRDNLISLTDGKGQTTTFTYDRNNRLTKETRPLSQETSYEYSATGQLTKKTDAKGQRIEYGYDDSGRMVEIRQYNAGDWFAAKTIVLTYNNVGNLTGYNDGTTSGTYTYDALNRKTGETVNYGTFSLTTGYTYNMNGTKKTFTYPNGTTIAYTYDSNNQPNEINIPGIGNITYNQYQWTRPTSMTLPGGTKQFTYDPLMRTKTIAATDPGQNPIMTYQYGYDRMDNITGKATEQGSYAYTYDDLYRLANVNKDSQSTETYTYDPVGNRLTSTTASNWTYNGNNELQSYDGTAYTYDANGNTTSKTQGGTTTNYVYDIDNRLIEVKDGSNNTIATYTYDPFGRRIKKIASPPAGEGQGEGVTYYLYSDEGLIGEYGSTGTEIKAYGYKPDSTWTTDPLFMKQGSDYFFYHNDHLGTPQKMTNISGAVVWSATYDAFGKATVDPNSTITNNLRFPGQYYDAETGLHYNYQRYYDAGTARFMTEDPIGFGGDDENLYRYVWNDPVNWFDNRGLFGDGQKQWRKDIDDWVERRINCIGEACTMHDPPPSELPKGHSDFTGSDMFDYTLEDKSYETKPENPSSTWRHFRKLSDVERDLQSDLDECNKDNFQRHMHQGQDYFVHYKKGWRKAHPPGVDNDPGAWKEAEEWTNRWVPKWKGKKCCEKK